MILVGDPNIVHVYEYSFLPNDFFFGFREVKRAGNICTPEGAKIETAKKFLGVVLSEIV